MNIIFMKVGCSLLVVGVTLMYIRIVDWESAAYDALPKWQKGLYAFGPVIGLVAIFSLWLLP